MCFACLLVEHLPTRVERLLNPDLESRPLVILRPWDERVLDGSADLLVAGVEPGDSRRRVEQLCPQARIILARDVVYQSYQDKLRDELRQFADSIECQAVGLFFIDVRMLVRSFPSSKALGLHIVTRAQQETGLLPTVGIAANKFTAVQAAYRAIAESSRVLVVSEGNESRFLAPLPLTVLPNPPVEMLRRLQLFGITTLGGMAQLPRAAVLMQFDNEAGFFYDLAWGVDPRPLLAGYPPPTVIRQLTLDDPLSDRHQVLAYLDQMAEQMSQEMEAAAHHAVGLSLTVKTDDSQEWQSGTAVKPPSAELHLLRRLTARLLGSLPLTSEVTGLILVAYPLRDWHLGACQLSLFRVDLGAGGDLFRIRRAGLQETLDLLRQRFGKAVIRLASMVGPPLPIPIQIQPGSDGIPTQLHWGGATHEVVRVQEMWRERRNWWDQLVVRDYHQLEIDEGLMCVVFRDRQGRWFLDRRRR